jgi:hypothetical protein
VRIQPELDFGKIDAVFAVVDLHFIFAFPGWFSQFWRCAACPRFSFA